MITLLAVGCGLAILLLMLTHRDRVALSGAVGGLLLLGGHTVVIGDETAGTAVRAAGLGVFLLVALLSPPALHPSVVPGLRALAGAGAIVYVLLVAMSWRGPIVLGAALTFLAAALAISLVSRSSALVPLARGLSFSLWLTVGLSVALYLVGWQEAMAGGRLRGVFANANTLGFFSAMAVLIALVTRVRGWRLILAVAALASLLASGSRASVLALVIGVGAYYARSLASGSVRGLVLSLAGTASAVAILNWLQVYDSSAVLRTENTREAGTQYALRVAEWSWLRGLGYGLSEVEVASTPLRWLAEGGLIAALLVGVVYIAVAVQSIRCGAAATGLAFFGITSSLFEGWYLAGGSALFIFYWITVASVSDGGPASVYRRGADSATRARLQRDVAKKRAVSCGLPPARQ